MSAKWLATCPRPLLAQRDGLGLPWPTTCTVFLPLSIPATAMTGGVVLLDMGVLLLMQPVSKCDPLVGREHVGTIPLTDVQCSL
jgi:hypothetical protein